MSKQTPKRTVRPRKPSFPPAKRYALLQAALEVGIGFGIHRWLKYRGDGFEAPEDLQAITEHLEREIMNEFEERFRL